MKPSWLSTLDDLERHLELQAELVEGGRYDEVVAFAPPLGLPTLPFGLMTRAAELLGRAQTLTDGASAMRDNAVKRLAQPHHLPFARRPVSAYVDSRA